ncbi:trehalose-phosphatase [Zhihengliuella salsuginis]|uniref:Trehalose 6-phosphate phosphatase n=1 Tax=Zhihengliuella salsuginis TaxID=578222 RepID=A0ABQ3GLW6_9MICC|nr:trehalose-phosphatase [Zhihengliuella salsuginis]GHD10658.1 trehalose 6-phosphate phosphatase [Zhihengliuella salsuginis]
MLPDELRAAVENLAAVPHLLVALDFDGTLAPFVDRPEDARALPGSAEALARLAEPGAAGAEPRTTTALLSGRHLESLRLVARPPEHVLLVGSHGAERYSPETGDEPLTLTDGQETLLAAATAALRDITAAFAGARLEHKPSGVVLHVRQCSTADGEAALSGARAALDGTPGIHVTEGKAVLEAAVVRVDKGVGLDWLRRVSGAGTVVFAGDDVTDEHAFSTLGPDDLGLKVGGGETGAEFRVGTLADVTEFLNLLTSVRRL